MLYKHFQNIFLISKTNVNPKVNELKNTEEEPSPFLNTG